jgi:hypothetical protein
MLAILFIFLFASFAVSVLTLTYVQIRVWNKHGWRALRERPLLYTYWAELSPVERALLWPGIIAFFLTVFSAAAWKVIMSING